jgi:hypothetical protein
MDKTAERIAGEEGLQTGLASILGWLPGQIAGLVHAGWYVSSLVLFCALLAKGRPSRGRDAAGNPPGIVVRRGRGMPRRMATLRINTSVPVLAGVIRLPAKAPEPSSPLLRRMRLLDTNPHRTVFALPSAADPRILCLTLTLRPEGDSTQLTIRTYRWKADDGLGAPHNVIRRLVRELREAAAVSEPQEHKRVMAAG